MFEGGVRVAFSGQDHGPVGISLRKQLLEFEDDGKGQVLFLEYDGLAIDHVSPYASRVGPSVSRVEDDDLDAGPCRGGVFGLGRRSRRHRRCRLILPPGQEPLKIVRGEDSSVGVGTGQIETVFPVARRDSRGQIEREPVVRIRKQNHVPIGLPEQMGSCLRRQIF